MPLCRKDSLLERDFSIFDAYWIFSPDKALIRYYSLKKRIYGTTEAINQTNDMSYRSTWKNRLRQDAHNLLNDYKNSLLANAAWKFFEEENQVFDAVVSSYGPAWTHLVAEKIKNKYPQIVWLADFRDPYAKETDGPFSFWYHKLFIKHHCMAADVITRVTDDMYLNEPENAVVKMVPNGYDPEEALAPLPPKDFTIVFTGVMYGERRDIGVVCNAIKELVLEQKIESAKVLYAGPDGEVAKKIASRYDAQEYLQDLGVLKRSDVLKLQQNAAILLQLNGNTKADHCQWTGKMYEYMMMRKPILFVITGDEPYSYPSRYAAKLDSTCYEQCRHKETYPLLKQYILDKYREWKKTGDVSVQRDEKYVQQFSYENIAESIWKLICP